LQTPRWHNLPQDVYRLVEETAGTVLLESTAGHDPPPGAAGSSLSRLFISPVRILVAHKLAELPSLFAEIEQAVSAGLQAAGYFSYECAVFFEPSAGAILPLGPEPLAWFGIYERPHVFDHRTGVFVDGEPTALAALRPHQPEPSELNPQLNSAFSLNEAQYARTIAQIHELIRAGDVYQLNFTMPIRVQTAANPAALYKHLRSRQPAPYGAFLHTQPGSRILSFSPELFFRIGPVAPDPRAPHPRRITTKPMKGTAPRGRTTAEDRAQAAWLAADPKNRAENVMIVDLLRNDLGRLCTFGSVGVTNLFAVERYPTLWQMTSTVSGNLRPGVDFEEIFRALFPCGSVTGAPKIRAMQCIAQLEHQPRGIYTGAIGYFSKEETVFNVAIRTLTLQSDGAQQTGTMGVGGGIVIDSEADAEWSECQLKAQFVTASSDPDSLASSSEFSLIETLLWNGDYPFLELHLDRLEDSASYFAFPFSRAEVKAALESHTAPCTHALQPGNSVADSPTRYPRAAGADSLNPNQKIRLLLNSRGEITITSQPIPAPATHPLRVHISTRRTNSRDPFYFHKTTHRPLYASALHAALAAGYDDVLFLNERGEVTEGAIHNLFIEKAGRLLTPPIACGLLPGVHRRHILATNPTAEERVLTLDDLRHADAIYLSNAVRGLRRAVIDWES
jgi:para-aminobenzoate synthetase/4-amino-4-deoxychorismate lyase